MIYVFDFYERGAGLPAEFMDHEKTLECIQKLQAKSFEWHVCVPYWNFYTKPLEIVPEDAADKKSAKKKKDRLAAKAGRTAVEPHHWDERLKEDEMTCKICDFLDFLDAKGPDSPEMATFVGEIDFFRNNMFFQIPELQAALDELRVAVSGRDFVSVIR